MRSINKSMASVEERLAKVEKETEELKAKAAPTEITSSLPYPISATSKYGRWFGQKARA